MNEFLCSFEFIDSICYIVMGDAKHTQVLKDQTHDAEMPEYVRHDRPVYTVCLPTPECA